MHGCVPLGYTKVCLHLTCLHTSASLTINENADPRVLQDLEAWMADVVPESRPYVHNDEGADDMPAHIRTALTSQTLSLSVQDGRLVLGTWQAVFLWEHRSAPHQRTVAVPFDGGGATPCKENPFGLTRNHSDPATMQKPGQPMEGWKPRWTFLSTVSMNSPTNQARMGILH